MEDFPSLEKTVAAAKALCDEVIWNLFDEYIGRPEINDSDYRFVETTSNLFSYGRTGNYDGNDIHIDLRLMESSFEIDSGEYLMEAFGLTETEESTLNRVYRCAQLRYWLTEEYSDFLGKNYTATTQEIADLLSMSRESIRVAQYAEGDLKLAFSDDKKITLEEIKRWLKAKKIVLRNVINEFSLTFGLLDKTTDEFIASFAQRVKDVYRKNSEQLAEWISNTLETDDVDSISDPSFLITVCEAKHPTMTRDFCELIHIDVEWLIKHYTTLKLESELKNKMDLIQALQPSTKPLESLLDENLEPNAENIANAIASHPGATKHPLDKKPNSKIKAFMVGGKPVAHEYNIQKQAIWIPTHSISTSTQSLLETKLYHKEDIGKDGKYGRHSGLKKYPLLGDSDVLKISITTMSDLAKVLNDLS